MLQDSQISMLPEKEKRAIYRYLPIRETHRSEELGEYVSYGLRVCRQNGELEREVARVSDLSTDARAVCRLARACNEGALSPIHLQDVIDDFLSE